ncbi:hypothetical protein EV363DRAFT_1432225 [Boletus edulis]|nr:hypothetical protein EV363DRAFT_1432225 [Boletus edulis]
MLTRGGETSCIDGAIDLDREALELRPPPPGHPDIMDVEEVIVLDREALELHPEGHPSRSVSLNNIAVRLITRWSISLNNLTVCLSTRYKQLGVMEDLDEAIAHARQSLDLRPKGHPHRFMSLISLAVCIYTRYMRLGVIE